MVRSSLVLALVAAVLVGCGAEEEQAATTTRPPVATQPPPPPRAECITAKAKGFRLCGQPTEEPRATPSTIQRRDGEGWTLLASAPKSSNAAGNLHGHWRQAWLSPDGKTLLAQWSAECEIPIAFFVDAETGAMRPVTGEGRWTDAPESIALGWGADGRAWVRLTKGYCGGSKHPPGVYLIDPATRTLTRAAARTSPN
jgi:hypothetical protein